MPLELIADRPGHACLQECEVKSLEPGELRVTLVCRSMGMSLNCTRVNGFLRPLRVSMVV